MDRALADKLIVAGYHYSMPGAGTFKRYERLRRRSGESLIIKTLIGGRRRSSAPSSFSELKCETGAAAARGFRLRIVHLERGADQVVDKIDFRSGHVVD